MYIVYNPILLDNYDNFTPASRTFLELIFVGISTSLGSLDVFLDLSLDYHISNDGNFSRFFTLG